MRSVGVFVYGDIGRSPRMQNHAVELSKLYQVYFMGYFETAPKARVVENPNIKIVDLRINHLEYFRAISFYLYALVRIVLQVLQILYYLGWKHRNLQYLFVQVIANLLLESTVDTQSFCHLARFFFCQVSSCY